MNRVFHRKRWKLPISYQCPKEGHVPDCIESNRSHLILSTHHQILRQQNHSISDDFVSKWQYAPKQGAKKVHTN
ncbi:hypothetical protein NC652_017766 [Populus alba x Populus x berolinensis]|nr:hypothetical protein NC652_017766 [Populus alba x Populus x berolinensis]